MSDFEVIARLKIRPGRLEGFQAQAAELLRLAGEKDTKTLRYDWFINEDALECEVHEIYEGEQGLIEHNEHIMESRAILLERYASNHRMSAYSQISESLADLGRKHAGGFAVFSLFQGLEMTAPV